jgi:hypothetical protein
MRQKYREWMTLYKSRDFETHEMLLWNHYYLLARGCPVSADSITSRMAALI